MIKSLRCRNHVEHNGRSSVRKAIKRNEPARRGGPSREAAGSLFLKKKKVHTLGLKMRRIFSAITPADDGDDPGWAEIEPFRGLPRAAKLNFGALAYGRPNDVLGRCCSPQLAPLLTSFSFALKTYNEEAAMDIQVYTIHTDNFFLFYFFVFFPVVKAIRRSLECRSKYCECD